MALTEHAPEPVYTYPRHRAQHSQWFRPADCDHCAAELMQQSAPPSWEETRAEAQHSSAGAGLALVLSFAVVVIVTGFALVITRPLPWDGVHLAGFLVAGVGVGLAWRALNIAGRNIR